MNTCGTSSRRAGLFWLLLGLRASHCVRRRKRHAFRTCDQGALRRATDELNRFVTRAVRNRPCERILLDRGIWKAARNKDWSSSRDCSSFHLSSSRPFYKLPLCVAASGRCGTRGWICICENKRCNNGAALWYITRDFLPFRQLHCLSFEGKICTLN